MMNSTEFEELEDVCDETIYNCYDDNTFSFRDPHTPLSKEEKTQKLTVDAIILFISTLSVLLNITIILLYVVMRHVSRKIPNYMLFSQATVDLLIGVYALLTVVPNFATAAHLQNSIIYIVTTTVIGQSSVFLALGNLLLTSTERFLALHKPFLHRRRVTMHKMILATVAMWIFSFGSSVFYLTSGRDPYHVSKEFEVTWRAVRMPIVLSGVFIVLLILTMTYRTIMKSIGEAPKRSTGQGGRGNLDVLLDAHRKDSRMMKIFISMATLYVISYLPQSIVELLLWSHVRLSNEFHQYLLQTVVFCLYICSAFFNPMLTLALKDDYRKSARILFNMKFDHHDTRCVHGPTTDEERRTQTSPLMPHNGIPISRYEGGRVKSSTVLTIEGKERGGSGVSMASLPRGSLPATLDDKSSAVPLRRYDAQSAPSSSCGNEKPHSPLDTHNF